MQVAGSGAGSEELVAPGILVDGRFRVASIVTRRGNASSPAREAVCNALDERTRQRVRLRFAPGRPDPRVLALRHPVLPEPLASGPGEKAAWVATAWFDGAPLTLPEAPLTGADPIRVWARALADVLGALDALHRATGRAHGAIGLSSFWVGADGRLRLMDATAPDGALAPDAVPWSPPERHHAPTSDPRSDLYAVAAVFYALATGRAPFGLDPGGASTGHRSWRVPDHPALPSALLAVLRAAMEKRPHHRFGSAARMREALEAALEEEEQATLLVPEPIDARAPAVAAEARAPAPAPDRLEQDVPPVDPDALDTSEELPWWEGTLDPAPRRLAVPRPGTGAWPLVRLLLVGGAGLVLSVATWIAVVGLVFGLLAR